MIARCQPLLNCLLFFVGLYIAVQHPPQYLVWLGIPIRLLAVSGDWQASLLKFAIYLLSCGLVLAAVDGRGSRRVFAALVFPFLPPLGIFVDAVATRVSGAIPVAGNAAAWAMLLRGSLFGITAALLITVPATFVYRRRVTAIAGLALAPVVARQTAAALYGSAGVSSYQHLLLQGCRYATFLICVTMLSSLLCLHLMPEDRNNSAVR